MRKLAYLLILCMFGVIGCNTGRTRVESPEPVVPETPEQIEPPEPEEPVGGYRVSVSDGYIEVRYTTNGSWQFAYVHYLPDSEPHESYEACVRSPMTSGDASVILGICVDHERDVLDGIISYVGNNQITTLVFDCEDELNHELCDILQDRFDDIYGEHEIERRVQEALQAE